MGHAPGERISGGLNWFCSPARGNTGHRSGELHGLGRQPEDSAFRSRETERGVGGDSRHLSPGLSPKRQPYLPRQSCTLTSDQGSRGRLGPPPAWGPASDRQPGRVQGLTGSAPGLPAALCRAPAGAPLAAPPSPARGLSAPPGRLQLFRMRGGGPEGAGRGWGFALRNPQRGRG